MRHMQKLIWILLPYLKLEHFHWRTLTPAEIALCQPIFANLIDYSKVKIMNHPFLPWQPTGMVMAPMGAIHLKPVDYCTDFAQESLYNQAIFIHEMTHIYQYQQQINVLLRGALLQSAYYLSCKRYNPYAYNFIQKKPFSSYNIEQQGDIAKDIFLKKIQNIIK